MTDMFDEPTEEAAADPQAEPSTQNGRISAGIVVAYLRKKHGREPTDDELGVFAAAMREAAAGLEELLAHRRAAVTLKSPRPKKASTPKRGRKAKRPPVGEAELCSCGMYGHTEDLCPEKA